MRKLMITLIFASLAVCAVALAANSQTYSQKFTTTHPGQATGITLRFSTKTQPKTVTLTFPAGMTIDPGAVKSGAAIGTGTATFQGTPPRSITVLNRVSAGHANDGVTLVLANPVGLSVSLKASYAGMGSQLVIPIPKFSIPPAVLTGLSVSIKGGSAHRPLLKTPRICPSGKVWKFSAAFAYPAGKPKRAVNYSTSACVKH
jgi:hypothetical protein